MNAVNEQPERPRPDDAPEPSHTSDEPATDDAVDETITLPSGKGGAGLFLVLTCGFLLCLCCVVAAFAGLVYGGWLLTD